MTEEQKSKKEELIRMLEGDEKARRILKALIANANGQTVQVENDSAVMAKLRELEVINDKGELIVQSVDIKDMIGEALEAKEVKNEEKKTFGFSTDYIERWESMLETGTDMLSFLAEQINPKVYGLLNVKKAIVLSLASTNDKWGDRGRCHLLMYGPPGTAKSALGEWLVHNLGIEGISHRSSDVGLTGCVVGKDIVPGALPCANESSIYIDEKMKVHYTSLISSNG